MPKQASLCCAFLNVLIAEWHHLRHKESVTLTCSVFTSPAIFSPLTSIQGTQQFKRHAICVITFNLWTYVFTAEETSVWCSPERTVEMSWNRWRLFEICHLLLGSQRTACMLCRARAAILELPSQLFCNRKEIFVCVEWTHFSRIS